MRDDISIVGEDLEGGTSTISEEGPTTSSGPTSQRSSLHLDSLTKNDIREGLDRRHRKHIWISIATSECERERGGNTSGVTLLSRRKLSTKKSVLDRLDRRKMSNKTTFNAASSPTVSPASSAHNLITAMEVWYDTRSLPPAILTHHMYYEYTQASDRTGSLGSIKLKQPSPSTTAPSFGVRRSVGALDESFKDRKMFSYVDTTLGDASSPPPVGGSSPFLLILPVFLPSSEILSFIIFSLVYPLVTCV